MNGCSKDQYQGWIIYKPFLQLDDYCDEEGFFGGVGRFGKDTQIIRFFETPPHLKVKLKIKLKVANIINPNGSLQINLDDERQNKCYTPTHKDIICSDDKIPIQPVQAQYIEIEKTFKNQNFLLSISSKLIGEGLYTYWGIKEIQLYLNKCPTGCQICDEGKECISIRLTYNFFVSKNIFEFQSDGWLTNNNIQSFGSCLNLPMFCGYKYCYQNTQVYLKLKLPIHQQIRITLRLFLFGFSSGYFQIMVDFINFYKLDIVDKWKEFYQVNYCLENEGTINYQTKNIVSGLKNHSNQNAIIQFFMSDYVTQFSFGIRDIQIFVKSELPIYYDTCGDGIIQFYEDCDDSNQIPFDGCYNCQYSCSSNCLNCVKGQCLYCYDDEILFNPVTFQCNNPITEKECPINCQLCNQGVCLYCQIPFTLKKQECVVECGDGHIAVGIEECDDGNNIEFDGCYQCKYECPSECQNCKNGICLDLCVEGLEFKNQQCVPICGDQIIIQNQEECDDGNDIQYDGCYLCQYSCPLKCNLCQDGDCIQCDKGFQLNSIENQCTSICGDFELAIIYEQCDDGNQVSNDGCSKDCMIETNHICKEYQTCQFYYQPNFHLDLQQMNEDNYVQQIILSFDQQVFIKIQPQQFSQSIDVTFLDLNITEYEINIIPIKEIQTKLADVEYLIQIEIYKTINYKPHARVEIKQDVYNKFSQSLLNKQQIIQIEKLDVLNDDQKKVSNVLLELQKKIIHSESTIVSLLLLAGSQFAFWNFLGVLQDQSYIKYINCHYPTNLLIFFQYANLASFNYYLGLLNIDAVQSFRYIQTAGKLNYYNYNPYFFVNITTVFISYFLLFLGWLITYGIIKLASKYEDKIFIKLSITQLKVYKSFMKTIYKQQNYIKTQGVNSVWEANLWDLFFLSFSYIKYGSLTYFDLVVAYLITITFIIKMIIQLLNVFNNYKQSQNEYHLKSFRNIKKLIISFILIFWQQSCVIQILAQSLITSFYLMIYFLKQNKKINYLESIREIQNQISILIVVSTSFFYEENLWDSNINRITLGWFHACVLLSVAASYLITDLVIIIKKGIQNILNKQKIIQANHQLLTFSK